ncbi:MAG: 50S ribosomal protein L32 [Myxococcales bacterium]|nr:50S ribosomal protein L32 [Myxococcales bacterium]MCB9519289.1 50S ribosomal protein L32 [Myxococcales bacterium]MCB9530733.1 50S ribosomal protein L32 [Myxococcales bacterium]MCB9533373.1 50S ribosomal protein L32 [Myxococcales bacterium]
MPVPKKKTSKCRTRRRRAQHDKVAVKNSAACPECGATRLPHRVCMSCGTYKGRQVVPILVR